MREIKFRAWDDTKSRWVIQTDLIRISLDGDIYYCDDRPNLRNDLIIQQFTGLCDKNGNEIYEGDVVKHREHWSDNRTKSLVYYTEYGYFEPFGCSDWAVLSSDVEVVGNIYENPEFFNLR